MRNVKKKNGIKERQNDGKSGKKGKRLQGETEE